jgi:SnoaL-like domain
MALRGKGYFIWKVQYCENGSSAAILNLAKQANFSHILIKVADGNYSYNLTASGADLVPPVAQALRAAGIQVFGWHYLYGDDPIGEANKAIQRIQQLHLDGYVLDVEGEYKESGKEKAAVTFMNRLRSAYPNLPVALCSYRFPSYHPQIPWKAFLERCDLNMPQVYWQSSHNPSDQLVRTINDYQSITPFRPMIPVGSAYQAGSWAATIDDVVKFMQTAQSLNLSATNFWEWTHTRQYLPAVWDAIQKYSWPSTPLPADITLQYVSALNSHNPDQVINLYTPNAVHVNAARTIQGVQTIRVWYQTILNQLLPNATFILTNYSGTGSSRQFTWTATSSAGTVLDGNDTLGLVNDRITYHYTFFTVTAAKKQAIINQPS